MKKLLLATVVLALASPAWAGFAGSSDNSSGASSDSGDNSKKFGADLITNSQAFFEGVSGSEGVKGSSDTTWQFSHDLVVDSVTFSKEMGTVSVVFSKGSSKETLTVEGGEEMLGEVKAGGTAVITGFVEVSKGSGRASVVSVKAVIDMSQYTGQAGKDLASSNVQGSSENSKASLLTLVYLPANSMKGAFGHEEVD